MSRLLNCVIYMCGITCKCWCQFFTSWMFLKFTAWFSKSMNDLMNKPCGNYRQIQNWGISMKLVSAKNNGIFTFFIGLYFPSLKITLSNKLLALNLDKKSQSPVFGIRCYREGEVHFKSLLATNSIFWQLLLYKMNFFRKN